MIPKDMRDQLGIEPGDEVDFALEDGAVRVQPIRRDQTLRGSLHGFRLVETLEQDRRAEKRR